MSNYHDYKDKQENKLRQWKIKQYDPVNAS